jgi:hypothetical protein
MDLTEFLKSLLPAIYLPVLASAIAATKLLVPVVKTVFAVQTDPRGYTSIKIAFGLSLITSFGYKWIGSIGTWSFKQILITLLVAVISAMTSIGLNITIQSLKGSDVSVKSS